MFENTPSDKCSVPQFTSKEIFQAHWVFKAGLCGLLRIQEIQKVLKTLMRDCKSRTPESSEEYEYLDSLKHVISRFIPLLETKDLLAGLVDSLSHGVATTHEYFRNRICEAQKNSKNTLLSVKPEDSPSEVNQNNGEAKDDTNQTEGDKDNVEAYWLVDFKTYANYIKKSETKKLNVFAWLTLAILLLDIKPSKKSLADGSKQILNVKNKKNKETDEKSAAVILKNKESYRIYKIDQNKPPGKPNLKKIAEDLFTEEGSSVTYDESQQERFFYRAHSLVQKLLVKGIWLNNYVTNETRLTYNPNEGVLNGQSNTGKSGTEKGNSGSSNSDTTKDNEGSSTQHEDHSIKCLFCGNGKSIPDEGANTDRGKEGSQILPKGLPIVFFQGKETINLRIWNLNSSKGELDGPKICNVCTLLIRISIFGLTPIYYESKEKDKDKDTNPLPSEALFVDFGDVFQTIALNNKLYTQFMSLYNMKDNSRNERVLRIVFNFLQRSTLALASSKGPTIYHIKLVDRNPMVRKVDIAGSNIALLEKLASLNARELVFLGELLSTNSNNPSAKILDSVLPILDFKVAPADLIQKYLWLTLNLLKTDPSEKGGTPEQSRQLAYSAKVNFLIVYLLFRSWSDEYTRIEIQSSSLVKSSTIIKKVVEVTNILSQAFEKGRKLSELLKKDDDLSDDEAPDDRWLKSLLLRAFSKIQRNDTTDMVLEFSRAALTRNVTELAFFVKLVKDVMAHQRSYRAGEQPIHDELIKLLFANFVAGVVTGKVE